MIVFNAIERHRRAKKRRHYQSDLVLDLNSYADCVVTQYEMEKELKVNRIDRTEPLSHGDRAKLDRIGKRIDQLRQTIMEHFG